MFEVFSYGDGKTLATIFNGVAMIVGGNDFNGLLRFGVLLGFTLLSIEMVFKGNHALLHTKYLLSVVGITTTLVGVKVPIKIVDKLTLSNTQVVQNIPFGLAAFAGMTSRIGDGLTKLFERTFAIPDDRKFEKHGMLFGARLLNDTALFEIRDDEFKRSVGDYSYQCIMLGVGIGIVNMTELLKSDDIWTLARTRLSQKSRSFNYWEKGSNGRVTRRLVTCQQGVIKLEARWRKIIGQAALYYGKRRYPYMTNTKAQLLLLQELPVAYSSVLGVSKNAVQMMRQAMMVNALQTGGAARMTDKVSVDNFLSNRITIQERLKNKSFWEMAGRKAIALFTILSGFLYVVFPIVILVTYMLGVQILKNYLISLVAVQTIPVFWAAINLFSINRADATFSSIASKGLTLVNQPDFVISYQDLSATSGTLAFMSLAMILVVFRGISALGSMAMTSAMNGLSSAQQASSEAASGNISLGNTSFENDSAFNRNLAQQKLGSTFDNRVTATDTMGGTIMESSDNITYAGAASSGMVSGIVNAGFGNQVQQVYNDAVSTSTRAGASYGSALHNTEGTSQDWRITSGAREDKNFSTAENTMKEWTKSHNFNEQDVTSSIVSATAGGHFNAFIFKASLEKSLQTRGSETASEDINTAWKNTDQTSFTEAANKYGEYANSQAASESSTATRDAKETWDASIDKVRTAATNLSEYENNSSAVNINATETLNRALIKGGYNYEDLSNNQKLGELTQKSMEIMRDPEFQNSIFGSPMRKIVPANAYGSIQGTYEDSAQGITQKASGMSAPNTDTIKNKVKAGSHTVGSTLEAGQEGQSADKKEADVIQDQVDNSSTTYGKETERERLERERGQKEALAVVRGGILGGSIEDSLRATHKAPQQVEKSQEKEDNDKNRK